MVVGDTCAAASRAAKERLRKQRRAEKLAAIEKKMAARRAAEAEVCVTCVCAMPRRYRAHGHVFAGLCPRATGQGCRRQGARPTA